LRTPLCVFGRARSESLPLVGGPVSIHDGFAHQFVANRAQKGAAGGRHLLLGCFAPQRLQLAQSHAPDAAQAGARGVPVSTLALRPLGTCSRRPIAHVQQLRGHLPRLLQQLRPPGSGAGGSIGGLHRRLIAASPPAALLCFWTAASDHPSSAPSACSCTSAPSGWRPRAASTARCLRAAPRPCPRDPHLPFRVRDALRSAPKRRAREGAEGVSRTGGTGAGAAADAMAMTTKDLNTLLQRHGLFPGLSSLPSRPPAARDRP